MENAEMINVGNAAYAFGGEGFTALAQNSADVPVNTKVFVLKDGQYANVGVFASMPGASAFSIAVFNAQEVPNGTAIFIEKQ